MGRGRAGQRRLQQKEEEKGGKDMKGKEKKRELELPELTTFKVNEVILLDSICSPPPWKKIRAGIGYASHPNTE